jgi:hypothetical protein
MTLAQQDEGALRSFRLCLALHVEGNWRSYWFGPCRPGSFDQESSLVRSALNLGQTEGCTC